MRKIFCLVLVLVTLILVSGCGSKTSQGEKTFKVTSAAERPAPEEVPPTEKFVVVDENFSNLQLDDPTIPVYDKYGVWDRREKNLPTTLPDIKHYDEKLVVYLTFDDGPDDKNTPQILDILKAENVPATFYVLGCMAERNPDVLRRIFNEGHAIGNHSYNHKYSELYSSPYDFIQQFIKTDEIIQAIVGVRPLIIRAPGGAAGKMTANYWEMVKSCGYVEHDWNLSNEDATSKRPNASMQVNNILNQLGMYTPKHAIILMHSTSTKDETVKALPEIIHLMRAWGYSFGVITPMTPPAW